MAAHPSVTNDTNQSHLWAVATPQVLNVSDEGGRPETCAAPAVTLEPPSESVSPRRLLLHCEDVIREKTHTERTTHVFTVAVHNCGSVPGFLICVYSPSSSHCLLLAHVLHESLRLSVLLPLFPARLIPLPVSLYYPVSRLISITWRDKKQDNDTRGVPIMINDVRRI